MPTAFATVPVPQAPPRPRFLSPLIEPSVRVSRAGLLAGLAADAADAADAAHLAANFTLLDDCRHLYMAVRCKAVDRLRLVCSRAIRLVHERLHGGRYEPIAAAFPRAWCTDAESVAGNTAKLGRSETREMGRTCSQVQFETSQSTVPQLQDRPGALSSTQDQLIRRGRIGGRLREIRFYRGWSFLNRIHGTLTLETRPGTI